MKTRFFCAFSIVLLSTGTLWAQVVAQESSPGYGAGFAAFPAFSQYGGGGYRHASTAAEGAARGAADLVRAAGDANLRNSLALRNVEEARSRNLDNRLKYADVYFEKRRINDEYRESKRVRVSPEQLFRIRQQKLPKRLSASQLDPVTGKITWPVLLQQDSFAEHRTQLEGLFASRASHDHLNYEDYQKIQEVGAALETDLSDMIKSVPPSEYIPAKSFLKSLMYEARLLAT